MLILDSMPTTEYDLISDVVALLELNGEKKSLLITIAFFLLLNLALSIVSFLFSLRLKRSDRKNITHEIREKNRTDIITRVYQLADALSRMDHVSARPQMQQATIDFDNYIAANRIYFSKGLRDLLSEMNDYYKSVSTNGQIKDYSLEKEFRDRFYDLFNS